MNGNGNMQQGGYPPNGGQMPPGAYPLNGGQMPPGAYPLNGGQMQGGGYPPNGRQMPPVGYPQGNGAPGKRPKGSKRGTVVAILLAAVLIGLLVTLLVLFLRKGKVGDDDLKTPESTLASYMSATKRWDVESMVACLDVSEEKRKEIIEEVESSGKKGERKFAAFLARKLAKYTEYEIIDKEVVDDDHVVLTVRTYYTGQKKDDGGGQTGKIRLNRKDGKWLMDPDGLPVKK